MSKFKDLINSDTPVLVDFYATWCGPCKMLTPILKELYTDLNGSAKIIKVDVDKNPKAAEVYGISGVPTMILFKNGEIKWRESGIRPAHELKKIIEEFV
ncbi:MAG: thioredoxin [Bacteroidia bacterium]|nr:thioredoxin [Bacteroidia bacterium]NNM15820.1 thioredoxin [Bacteroidia bacterium]